MNPLELVKLTVLMDRTEGNPDITIGLIDGPIVIDHSDLASERLREVPGSGGGTCNRTNSVACRHGTFIAGILSAKRSSAAPAICPNCTLVVRPIFSESSSGGEQMPSVAPRALAAAIVDCVGAGARVINLSLALEQPSTRQEPELDAALNQALRAGVIVVAAAGNQGTVGSSAITRHPWVIPVVACDRHARPTSLSNLSASIGTRGLRAPGERITSLGAAGPPLILGGTSVAVPFVTGAIALLWSEFPTAAASHIKLALTRAGMRRTSVVPPLLNALAASQALTAANGRRSTA